MIHAEIVRNAHGPGKEFTFFRVPASPDGVNDLNQYVLKNVLGQVFVLNEEKD
jgi:hypothetical protein